MKKNKPIPENIKNTAFSVTAIILYNCTLQLYVYPTLNNVLGSDYFGEIIYILSILSIFANSFGSSIKTNRIVRGINSVISNGDCNIALLLSFVIGTIISIPLFLQRGNTYITIILYVILLFFMIIRYYADIQYQITGKFQQYILYYSVLSIGYIIGVFIFSFSAQWIVVFLIGEFAVVFFSFCTTPLYSQTFKKSPDFIHFSRTTLVLTLSYLVYATVLNLDRIILMYILGETSVAHYFTASIIGKTIVLLISPLNTVIVSYILRKNPVITHKKFVKIVCSVILIGCAAFIFCVLCSPIFIRFFYPGYYNIVFSDIPLISLGQIIGFLSSILLVILLFLANNKWQLIIQLLYAVIFIAISIPFTYHTGIRGMAIATSVAGFIKFIFVIIVSFVHLNNIGVSKHSET